MSESTKETKFSIIHHFVPHPFTQQRATLLSHFALFSYIFVTLVFFISLKSINKISPGVLGYASNISVVDLLNETNDIRVQNGLSPLRLNSNLSHAAELKAQDMFNNNYWAHVSPDGVKPWHFILTSKYDYEYAGENLAKNFDTSVGVIQAWYKSTSHRDNLLSANYDDVGFAVVNGELDGYKTTLVVQMFGRPRSGTVVGSIESNDVQGTTTILESVPETQPQFNLQPVGEVKQNQQPEDTHVYVNIPDVSAHLILIFTLFISLLLGLDIWYTRKKSIAKFTGHTIAHITFLVLVLVGVWLVISPGKII